LYKLNIAFPCILFAFLSLLVIADASAQQKVYLGLKAGGGLSKTTRSAYSFANPARFGLNPHSELGIVAQIPFNDSLSFQPEILLVKKGYQAFGLYNTANGRPNQKSYEQWENTYIEVPLLAKLAVGNRNAKFFFAAGPAFSLWTSSNYYRDSTGGNVVKEKYKVENKFLRTVPKVIDTILVNNLEKLVTASYDSITVIGNQEVSAVFATGFQYKFKKSILMFDIRYVYGLTDLYKYLEDRRPLIYEDETSPRHQPARNKEFNRRFSFSISYLFSFN
jgi:hypothetical protein